MWTEIKNRRPGNANKEFAQPDDICEWGQPLTIKILWSAFSNFEFTSMLNLGLVEKQKLLRNCLHPGYVCLFVQVKGWYLLSKALLQAEFGIVKNRHMYTV